MALWNDVRVAMRSLARQPAFTLTVLGILAVAIGANTAIFSLINAALLRALPFDEPERLVMGRATFDGRVNPYVSGYDYYDYREESRSFEGLASMGGGSGRSTVLVDREPDRVDGLYVSWDLFPVLRVAPAVGRLFREDDAAAGRDEALVISHAYWQRRFGGAPDVIDRTVIVDGRPRTIVGVLPAGFHFMFDADIWSLTYRDGPLANARRFHNLLLVGRLAPGVSLAQAQSEADLISRRLEAEYPGTNTNKALRLSGLADVLVEGVRTNLLMLMGAVALVLLMACANVAGLLLARGQSRLAEVAVRTAIGASRWSLVRQFLVESTLLSVAAGAVGLGLAVGLQRLLIQLLPVGRLGIDSAGIDGAVLLFVLALSMATGLVFGTLPAFRGSVVDLSAQLKSAARTTEGRSGSRLRRGVLVVQVALGVVLLIGAGLLIRSLARQADIDLGFAPANVLTAGVRVSERDYPGVEQRIGFFTSLVDEVRVLPGVEAVGLVSQLPIRHPGGNIYVHRPGEVSEASMARSADFRVVLPGYFQSMGIPLVAGRDIANADGPGSRRVMVVSQSLAGLLFPGEDPIGQPVVVDMGEPVVHEVVGVVGDARLRRVRSQPFHAMYMSLRQAPRASMFLTVKTATNPAALITPIREVLQRKDPTVPLAEPATMAAIVDEAVAEFRVVTLALGLFAAVALALALVGLYGVLDYQVRQRRRELGVRMALGASPAALASLVLGRGLVMTGLGLAAGTAGAVAATRALQALLFEVTPTDPATFVAVPALFGLVTIGACLLPAWRAARVNPAETLRGD